MSIISSTRPISLLIGGVFIIVGVALLLVSSLNLNDVATKGSASSAASPYVSVFIIGLLALTVGIFFAFVGRIAKQQI